MELLKEYLNNKDKYNYNKLNTEKMYIRLTNTDGHIYNYKVSKLKGLLLYMQFNGGEKEKIHNDLLIYYEEEEIKYMIDKIKEDANITIYNMHANVMYVELYEKGLIDEWNY